MDFLQQIDIATATFVLLATFGTVSLIAFSVKKRFGKEIDSETKIVLSILLAFAFGFVPASMGNEIANRIREAIAIGVTLNGAYQFASGVAKKVSTSG